VKTFIECRIFWGIRYVDLSADEFPDDLDIGAVPENSELPVTGRRAIQAGALLEE